MSPRYSLLRSLLSPAQLADLEKVQSALEADPTCLEKHREKRIHRLPDQQNGLSEGSPDDSQ
jgi:hypothetical protein